MTTGIKLQGETQRLDYKSATLLFKTINAQERELRKRLAKLNAESREVKKALFAIQKTKLILLRVQL